MVATKIATQHISKADALDYFRKATTFITTARILVKTGGLPGSITLESVHATISATDALLGFEKGEKSKSSDHHDIVRLIKFFAPQGKAEEWNKQAERVSSIIAKKHLVGYEKREPTEREARQVFELADRYYEWVKGNLPKS